MGLFSAIGKGFARFANDKHAENQRKKAKSVAYEKAGIRMKKASKRHTYLNGATAYKEELRKENEEKMRMEKQKELLRQQEEIRKQRERDEAQRREEARKSPRRIPHPAQG